MKFLARHPKAKRLALACLIITAIQVLGASFLGVSPTGSLVSNLCQIAASSLAIVACLKAVLRAHGQLRLAWLSVGSAIALWTVANISWTYHQNWLGYVVASDSLTNFGFIVYRIPIGLALLAEGDGQDKPILPRVLDTFQFLLLGILIYFEICFLPKLNQSWRADLPGDLLTISLVSNIFLVAAFPLRSLYASTVEFREFCRKMSFFLAAFFLLDSLPLFSNAGWYTPSGTWFGLAFTLPFLVGALVISSWQPDSSPIIDGSKSLSRSVWASVATSMVPALVPILLLVLGSDVEEKDRPVAILVCTLSLLAFGVRFVLIQREQEKSHAALADIVEQLKESTESFQSLFLVNPLPMWVYSRATLAFLAVNDAAVAKYGYSRDEFLQMTVLDIRPQDERERFLRNQDSRDFQPATTWQHKTKSGQIIDVEITAHRLRFGDHEAELIVSNDISERLRTQKALEESEKLYRAMFEDAPFALYRVHDDSEHYQSVNSALVSLLGYESKEELLSVPVSAKIYVDPQARTEFRRKVTLVGRAQVEVEWMRKNGERINVRLTGRAIQVDEEGGLIFEVAVEDVSETKHLQERLLHAQKMESIGTLAGGVAHDFNNILMITSAYSEMLESELGDRPNLKSCAVEIRKAVDRASAITSQLLAFSRKQRLNPVVLNANTEVQELRPMLKRLCGEKIEIEILQRDDHALIEIDRGQFAQVLINLAANARDAMPNGGKIAIKTDVDRNSVVICFADNGCGMDESIRAKVFEPFFTTKDVGKGTGLGLATVYGIVKSANGEIEVTSQAGEGTTFLLRFPLVTGTQSGSAPSAMPLSGTAGTILIVDDEGSLCGAISEYLESKGHSVHVAGSGDEALRMARELAHVDVLLSDVAMPGIRGPELANAFRLIHPAARVVLMTGYAESGENSEIPADMDLLIKPVSLAELDQHLRKLIPARAVHN